MDPLRGWPEPVVPVQSIADCCPSTLPPRYVKPEDQRPSPATVAVDPSIVIPVVDLAAGTGDATARAVSAACRDWGFFQVVNHGVSPGLLRRVREVWRAFFGLPMPEKLRLANTPATYEGYGSRLGVVKGAILDWGDYFFLHLKPERLKDHAKWPEEGQEVVEEYGREVVRLCVKVLGMMAVGLGMEEDRLREAFGGGDAGACLRVNYYSKCPQPELALGLSSHSDPGGITVLLTDEAVDGLQVRRGDKWVPVRPVADALIVNVGDQVQVLTNGEYPSVEHRVVVNSLTDRLSLAFFYNPRSDLPIGPLPELVGPGEQPCYRCMSFDEYRVYIRTVGPKGKSQVESLEAK